ncbi:MAG: DUF362 domain-containing protein [Phycisphaerae bacterium]|nr:DUF362 domain-containing protein [Phycisphaerae bacterium]
MTAAPNSPQTVAVVRCPNYVPERVRFAVGRLWDLLDPNHSLIRRGDRVLIKPNCIVPRPPSAAAQTDPTVILGIAELVRDLGGRPVVADSTAWGTIRACLEALGILDELKRRGIEVRTLNHPQAIRLPGVSGFRVPISRVALEADRIINLPKLKSHQQLGATFAVKNMFGVVPGKRKPLWHYLKGARHEDFCRMLIEIFRKLNPAVNIIDAVVGMEGPGPINGRPRPLGAIIGGIDPIACEMICCELIGFDPFTLPILHTARSIGFGCSERNDIEVVGDRYDDLICHDFQPAVQTPLRFSLPRVCKSIAKQTAYILQKRLLGTNKMVEY